MGPVAREFADGYRVILPGQYASTSGDLLCAMALRILRKFLRRHGLVSDSGGPREGCW